MDCSAAGVRKVISMTLRPPGKERLGEWDKRLLARSMTTVLTARFVL